MPNRQIFSGNLKRQASMNRYIIQDKNVEQSSRRLKFLREGISQAVTRVNTLSCREL